MATKKHSKKRKKGHLFGKPVGSVVKHPGAVREAAEKHGVSTKVEAEREAKSPDKHVAARGRLAKRFMGIAKHGNIKKAKGKKHHTRKRVGKA
jgi:hypothetical protein